MSGVAGLEFVCVFGHDGEHPPTALRIATVGPMIERLVHFQEPRYRNETAEPQSDRYAY